MIRAAESTTGNTLSLVRMELPEFSRRMGTAVDSGGRLGLLTARNVFPSVEKLLVALVIYPDKGNLALFETSLGAAAEKYPSLTPKLPQAHWFERAINDMFGIRPEGHPRFKSVLLHEAWPRNFHPLQPAEIAPPYDTLARRKYKFLEVKGEGVYEIPVGPIHAGIIEPGHFRLSCLGEIIQNLEIRLGYQHRGIERQMTDMPWRRTRFLAEAASSDTAAGNALAHALAIESMLSVAVPPMAVSLRALALEIERIASHLGDLSGICSDIGFAGGAAVFGCLRGRALGLGEWLSGSRFLTSFIQPGGVSKPPSAELKADIAKETIQLENEFNRAEPLLMDNPGALERMEGLGIVRPSLARDFGLVGPAGRSSGQAYDVREALQQEPYRSFGWQPSSGSDGDVLARVQMRVDELRASLTLVQSLLDAMPDQGDHVVPLPDALPANQVGVGMVEAWRGELIHLIFTNEAANISRYCIKDPSFNNWTGLAIAARGELVADFPLCNKSFGLSYSGNDL